MKRLLLIEDEKMMAKNIAFFLNKEGYSIDIAYDGQEGLDQFRKENYDLLLLDWTLPKMDGLEVCRTIRKFSNVPIIMITAKDEILDKVLGLEVCADDYLTKPFHQRELLARIHALLRRNETTTTINQQLLHGDGLILDKDKMVIRFQMESIPLTTTEFKLLETIMRRPENVYSREFLYETVWGSEAGFNDRTIDVNISRLRKKLYELTGSRYLYAIRGTGYKFGEK